jgi:hypothetical protein
MSDKKEIQIQPGVAIHRKVATVRSSSEFDIHAVSLDSRNACRSLFVEGNATPEQVRRVFSLFFGSTVIDELIRAIQEE